jgi:hypothetical protein
MATTPIGSFQVTNGPSKFDLMLSVFERKVVTLALKRCGVKDVRVIVSAIEQEDGSCDSWCVKGFIVQDCPIHQELSREYLIFEGYYSTKDRMGHIDLLTN